MNKSNYVTDIEKEILSYNAYHLDNPIILDGWKLEYKEPETSSSFEGQVYKKGEFVIIVFKGSKEFKDFLLSDIPMAAGVEPMQQKDAHVLLLKALSMFENENVKIELTGHSLGGSLAQIESARTGIPATTFNAFGTGKILQSQGFSRSQIYKLNIKNYGNPMDPIFNSNSIYQPGRTFITNTILDINKIYPFTNTFGKADMIYHELEKMGDLNKAVEVTPFVKKMNSNNVYHGYVYKIDKIYQDVDNLNIKQNNKNIQNIQSNYTPSDVQLQEIKSLYNMNSIANFHSKEVYNYGLNNSNNVQTDDSKRATIPTSPKVQSN